MAKSDRYRSRLGPRDLGIVFQRTREWHRDGLPVNPIAHEQHHNPMVLVYTSKETLDTTAGTPIYPTRGGTIVGARVSVAGAPSGADFDADILLDGSTIFDSNTKPTIANGETYGYMRIPDEIYLYPDSKIQWQITNVSSATGPFVGIIEILPEAGGQPPGAG